jgi:hypothetical protein
VWRAAGRRGNQLFGSGDQPVPIRRSRLWQVTQAARVRRGVKVAYKWAFRLNGMSDLRARLGREIPCVAMQDWPPTLLAVLTVFDVLASGGSTPTKPHATHARWNLRCLSHH